MGSKMKKTFTYQETFTYVANLLKKKKYIDADTVLDQLYQFKPLPLIWFVYKAEALYYLKGYDAAKDMLDNKYMCHYCYEGTVEALNLQIFLEEKNNNEREVKRYQCILDLLKNIGTGETIYEHTQSQLEHVAQTFCANREQSAQILELSYTMNDPIAYIICNEYRKWKYGIDEPVSWLSTIANMGHLKCMIQKGDFLFLTEPENQSLCLALAHMLTEMGRTVVVLLPPTPYSGTESDFFNLGYQENLKQTRYEDGVEIIPTYCYEGATQQFQNQHQIIEVKIEQQEQVYTVLGSGCILDDVGLSGEVMRKKFSRFDMEREDIFENNLAIGWTGDYLKLCSLIYDLDARACMEAPNTCKFSIIIPARNSIKTLQDTIQTCLKQDYPHSQYEIVISDNSTDGNTQIKEFCMELNDPRIRYVHTNRDFFLTRSFEFAFFHARGEYIFFLGSDDGLLPWALSTLDNVTKHFPEENIIQWTRAFYCYPHLNGMQDNELVIPFKQKVGSPIHVRKLTTEQYLEQCLKNPQNMYSLPMNYIASTMKRSHYWTVLEKTGRLWDGNGHDVNFGIVNICLNSSVLNLDALLSIAGMSSSSMGMVSNSGAVAYTSTYAPKQNTKYWIGNSISVPEKLVDRAMRDVTALYQSLHSALARGILPWELWDKKADYHKIFDDCMNCMTSNVLTNDQFDKFYHINRYTASWHGEEFLKWFDEKYQHIIQNHYRYQTNQKTRIYQEVENPTGTEVLDASRFGISNVAQAAEFIAQRYWIK